MTSITGQEGATEQNTRQTLGEMTPIIIKRCQDANAPAACFIIDATSCPFIVEENSGSSSKDWIKSTSQNSTPYIQSIVCGADRAAGQQICETSQFTHPLTVDFVDESDTVIFSITETKDATGIYQLEISVPGSNNYFEITQPDATAQENDVVWLQSTFESGNAELTIQAIEIWDGTTDPNTGQKDPQEVYSLPNPIFPITISVAPAPPQPE
jgi:hypothetical protein